MICHIELWTGLLIEYMNTGGDFPSQDKHGPFSLFASLAYTFLLPKNLSEEQNVY